MLWHCPQCDNLSSSEQILLNFEHNDPLHTIKVGIDLGYCNLIHFQRRGSKLHIFFCIFRKHIEFSSNVDAVFFCEMIVLRASSWLFTELLYLLHLQQKSFQLIVHRIPLSPTPTTKELPADCSQNYSISYIYNKRASSWWFTEFLYLLHLQQS
jgi:hypothetical protein